MSHVTPGEMADSENPVEASKRGVTAGQIHAPLCQIVEFVNF